MKRGEREDSEMEQHPPYDQTDQRTMADRLAGRIGTVNSGRGDLSERARELFIEGSAREEESGPAMTLCH